MKKTYLFLTIGIIVSVVSIIYIVDTVSLGLTLSKEEQSLEALSSENRNLSESLVNSSSLTSLQGKVGQLGFVTPTNLVYLKGDVAVAKAN